MFKNLSIHFKLILAFLLISFLLAAASFYQIRSIQHFNSIYLNLIEEDFERLGILENIALQTKDIHNKTLEYRHDILQGQTANTSQEKALLTTMLKNLRFDLQAYHLLVTNEEDSYIDQAQIDETTRNADSFIQKSQIIFTATGIGPTLEALESEQMQAMGALDQSISRTIDAEQKGIDLENKEASGTISELLTIIIGVTIATTVAAIAMGLGIARWMARSFSRLKKGADYIANGDFTHPIPISSHDEIGQLGTAFNNMSGRLKDAYRRQAVVNQRDEAILQSMGEGLIALDEKGRTVLINQVACEFLNISDSSTLIGKSIAESMQDFHINDKNDKPITLEQMPSYKTLQTGEIVNDTFVFHAADERKILFYINSSPVKLGNKVVGAVVVLRDVTKEKEVDRMKTEFISLASHQLRTPLSAIRWYSEMLISGDAGKLLPDQLEFVANISDSTERMIGLVNALLNIARIESGRIMIQPRPTDLKELVSGIINDLKAKTEAQQQTLIISVHDDLPKINLDPRLIGQVYLNLLTNAIKYTPKGGEISVFVSRKDDQIISQVTDNGYGIPKAQQDRVFEKFFRAANAVKVETDGTGLGLYLIKSVVESSGGKIWFESEEGKGTSFWFSIPVSGMEAREGEVTLDA